MLIPSEELGGEDCAYFVKAEVSNQEYTIQKMVYDSGLGIKTPRIIEYDADARVMTMQKIEGSNLYDLYGQPFEEVSKEEQDRIREMIGLLYYQLGIVFVDLTSFNVMKDRNDELWLIDYGHAKYHEDAKDTEHKYVLAFLDGEEGWNRDYY